MSSGLDWERFGVITGGDEVCILPPPTLSEKGVGIPTLSIAQMLGCTTVTVLKHIICGMHV